MSLQCFDFSSIMLLEIITEVTLAVKTGTIIANMKTDNTLFCSVVFNLPGKLKKKKKGILSGVPSLSLVRQTALLP